MLEFFSIISYDNFLLLKFASLTIGLKWYLYMKWWWSTSFLNISFRVFEQM